jgi:hypothetical protein
MLCLIFFCIIRTIRSISENREKKIKKLIFKI